MVFQVEGHVVHGDPPFEDDPARIVQDKARHQTEHQMPVIGIFAVDLADITGQKMPESAEHLFNQMPTRPDPKQARRGVWPLLGACG